MVELTDAATGEASWRRHERRVGSPLRRGVLFPDVRTPGRGPHAYRRIAVYDPVRHVAYVSKVGYTSLNVHTGRQIDMDVGLLLDPDAGVRRVEWHFYGSSVTLEIGPSSPLMDYLDGIRPDGARAPRIPFYVHMAPTP